MKQFKNYSNPITIEKKQVVSSTNAILKDYAKRGFSDYVLIADEQTDGRGRYNRSYYSPKDSGIYFSVLLRPYFDISYINLITPICAVAVCKSLEEFGITPEIKWVNDILINNKKVCGILVESILGKKPSIVIGIGINLFEPKGGFPDDIKNKAGFVFSTKNKQIKEKLVNLILENFFKYYSKIESKDYFSYYKEHCITLGKEINLVDVNGDTKHANVIDLDKNFGLIISNEDGSIEIINSGEASILL